VRDYDENPGLFAVSRIDPKSEREIVIAFNTSDKPITRNIEVDAASGRFTSLYGRCPAQTVAPATLSVTLAPLDFVVCAAQ
jgi:hypothetical protein